MLEPDDALSIGPSARDAGALPVVGYTTPVVVHPGEGLDLHVSCTESLYTVSLARLGGGAGVRGRGGALVMPGLEGPQELPGREQALPSGSWAIAPLPCPLPGSGGVTVQLWAFPTSLSRARNLATAERRCLVSLAGPGGALELELAGGRPVLVHRAAGGELVSELAAPGTVGESSWCFLGFSLEETGRVRLCCTRLDGAGLSGDGPAPSPERPFPAASRGSHDGSPLPLWWGEARWPDALLLVGTLDRVLLAASDVGDAARGLPSRHFNGKLESPRLFSRALDAVELEALAKDAPPDRFAGLCCAWNLVPSAGARFDEATDGGPLGAPATLVNSPTRAVTGHAFDGSELDPARAPQVYNAAHFHDDDLTDCAWDVAVSVEIPDHWPSGVYGFALETAAGADVVPFIVSAFASRSRLAVSRARLAMLMPTFSYLAYANEHASWESPIASSGGVEQEVSDRDRYAAARRLLSIYDRHSDGSGACYSSWRRPVVNFRPGYHLPLLAGPHQLSADLELLEWLSTTGIEYEVIADDDLHAYGPAALAPFRVVVTGSHPEYWSAAMLRGLAGYLTSGGRLAYLGGNGLYWVTSTPPGRSDLIEVRRGRSGTRVWESEPGEEYHATTGERGGIWRNRGWAPQRLVGVGFTAQGFDESRPYRWLIDSSHPTAGFIAEGVDVTRPLGTAGSVLGGAAGFEIDRTDPALGTPSAAVLVARAEGFSDAYQGVVDDILTSDSLQGGSVSPLVHADMVLVPLAGGGAVFSTGSIAWCGALALDAGVARVTRNVLERFLDDAPLAPS